MEHTESLRKQVEEQGHVVRELKVQKAPKEEISTALNKLFSLKTELKEAEQMEIGNLLEEIQKLKLENRDETLIKEKEERVSQLQKLVEPEPEKKTKEKKVLEQCNDLDVGSWTFKEGVAKNEESRRAESF